MNASRLIAEFSIGFNEQALTPDLLHQCSRSLLDTYAVALAGAQAPASRAALAYCRRLGRPAAGEGAALWGSDATMPVEAAALWNGIAAHVLDFDDVTSPLRGHPSVMLWPALLALAQTENLHGRRLASAYVVGFEVMCKFARAMAVPHYAQGWHATASIGILGSAVACAHLLGLDAERTGHAIGLAIAQAGGIRENVGTDAKSFQVGQGNAAALRAALLAREGFQASPSAVDGEFGYLRLYAQGRSARTELATLGQRPLELFSSGLEVKKYPMCYATHRALDALLALRAEHGFFGDQVAAIDVTTSAGALVPLVHPNPCNGMQGKFSMEYAMAAAALGGVIRLETFTDAAVRRPGIAALMAKTTVHEAPDAGSAPSGPLFRWAQVKVSLYDGRSFLQRTDLLRGSRDAPLSDLELRDKAEDCLRWGNYHAAADDLFAAAMQLGKVTARELVLLLQESVRVRRDDHKKSNPLEMTTS